MKWICIALLVWLLRVATCHSATVSYWCSSHSCQLCESSSVLVFILETASPFRNDVSVFFPFCYKREAWIRNQIFSSSWVRLQDHCTQIFFLIAFKTLMGHREIYEHRSRYPLWTFSRRRLLKSINKSGNSQLSRPKLWSGPCCYGPRSFLVVSLLPLLLPISNKILPLRIFTINLD
jgi:hypothetical protein